MQKHRPQLSTILEGMFEDEEAGDPENWIMQFNTVVGGVCHQHPHCDSGRVGTYQDLTIFPFVALHGYGLMHEFNADQMLFMQASHRQPQGDTWSSFPFLKQVGMDGMPSGCEVTAKSQPFRGNTLPFH